MDVVGGFRLADGSEAKIVSGSMTTRGLHLVAGRPRATARPMCEALALRRYGVQEQILTDNGKVFTGRFGPGTGEVLFDRICRENGIKHLLTAPRSPTTTGKIERWHRTLRREFLTGLVFTDLADAQAQLGAPPGPPAAPGRSSGGHRRTDEHRHRDAELEHAVGSFDELGR